MNRALAPLLVITGVLGLLVVPAAAKPAVETNGGTYVTFPAARIADTRHGLGGSTPAARGVARLAVLGHGGVPSTGVGAVVATLTVASPSSAGYLTAYRTGTSRPAVSMLNFAAGQTVANGVVVPVGSDGTISVYNGSAGAAPLLLDVSGFYRSGAASTPGAFTPVTPKRVLDTRRGLGGTRPGPHGKARFDLGLPYTTVLLNVTATGATRSGYLTALPGGSGLVRSNTALSFPAAASVANRVVVTTGAAGTVDLQNFSSGSTDLLADLIGKYRPGTPSAPGALATPSFVRRVYDSREPRQDPVAGTPRQVEIDGASDSNPDSVPASVLVAVTITGATGAGYFRASPNSYEPTGTSIMNFVPGRTVTTLVELPLGGTPYLYVSNVMARGLSADVIIDLVGWTRVGDGASLASLTGVTRSENAIVPGVTVLVYAGTTVVARGRSDAAGNFRVDGVPASDPTDEVCFDATTAATTTVHYASECYEHLAWDGVGPPTGEQLTVQGGTLGGEAEALYLTPTS